MLGQEFFDVEARDVATLVALEVRERGAGRSSGPVYAVLEYDRNQPTPDAWTSTATCRLALAELDDVSASRTLAIKQAVHGADTSLDSTARLLARRSRLYPAGSPP